MSEYRTIDSAFKRNLIWLVSMYEFDTEGSPMYLHDNIGDIEWDNKTWNGLGGLITDSGISDDGTLSPVSVTFSLTAWIQELVVSARTETYVGRRCRKLLVPRDMSTGNLIGTPLEIYRGQMGPIVADPNAQTLSMTAQDERTLMHRSIGAVFENAEFQARDDNSGWVSRPVSEAPDYNTGDTFFVDAKREKDKKGPRFGFLT